MPCSVIHSDTLAPPLRTATALILVATLVSSAAAFAFDATAVDRTGLIHALRHRGLEGARVGAVAIDLDTGAEVFASGADLPMIAASNVKILTAVAALDTFGPTHRFKTEIRADHLPDTTGRVGKLVVVGGGDPSLTSEQMWRLAADLSLVGLRRVDGDLVLDAGVFDDQLWNPYWGKTSSRAYHAPVAGLSVNYGAFTVAVVPGRKQGAPAGVFVDPALPYFTILNQTKTSAGRAAKLTVTRTLKGSREQVRVSGNLGSAAEPRRFYRSVTRPVHYAGAVLAKQLEANGITVNGHRIGRVAPGDVLVTSFDGKPLAEIVRLFMKYSNNGIAESLVKSIGQRTSGAPGTWKAGVAAARARLLGLGLAPDSFTLVDGSGLSRENRVTARCLVGALRIGARSFDFGPEFVASLPIANRDGTLEKRATAARDAVRAKTGLLTGATALSGIARSDSGRRFLFSIIANGYKRGDADAMAALDSFAAAVSNL